MANLSLDEIRALKAGTNSLYVFVALQQSAPIYKAGGQEISKSVLDALCVKRLARRVGRNYKLTDEGYKQAHMF
jgi:hypothetical protein